MIYDKREIGELVTLRQGFAINKKTNHYMSEEPTPLHLLRIGDMKDGNFSIFVKDTIPEKFIAKENDIIYTRTGQVGLVFRKQYGVVHNNCFTVTTNDEEVLSQEFIYYVLQEKSFYEEAISRATGAAQPDLPHGAFKSIQIFLPPIESQRKITDILNDYNSLIENNQKQIKLLEEAAQRLYKEWFVDLRFPGYENVKVVDGVPEGWKITAIGDIGCQIESGSRPKGGIDSSLRNGIPSIGAENVIGLGKYNFTSDKYVSSEFYDSMKRGKLKDRDILVYKDGAYIGKTSLFQDGFPHKIASVNEHVFLLHTENENLQYYLFFTLYQHEYFLKMQKLNKNAAQPGINAKSMLSLNVLLPPLDLVQEFDMFATPIMKSIFAKAKQNCKLAQTRDRLLLKLMSGELEV